MRPRVLMATSHDWGSPLRLGCHHLAAGFVEAGCDVAYVSTAISPAHAIRDRREFRDRIGRRRRGGHLDLDGHLWAYTPVALLTPHNAPLIGGRTIHREWYRLTVPNVVRAVRHHGFDEVDLLYVDSPIQGFWLRPNSARRVGRASRRSLLGVHRHLATGARAATGAD